MGPGPELLTSALNRVRPRLGRIASRVLYYPTVGSTNDVAAAHSTDGLVVVADEQTAGRGRRGHRWFSPPGSGLYVSVVLTPSHARVDPLRAATLLTLAAGVAIAEGIEAATGLAAQLKWPNDLYVGRRKLAGILAEGSPGEPVVLGYGLNITPAAYPPDIADRATSIESELGRAADRHHVLAETLASLSRRYDDLLEGRFDAILDAWRHRAPSAVGTRVSWGSQSGITRGIDDQGALVVQTASGVERVASGELVWDL